MYHCLVLGRVPVTTRTAMRSVVVMSELQSCRVSRTAKKPFVGPRGTAQVLVCSRTADCLELSRVCKAFQRAQAPTTPGTACGVRTKIVLLYCSPGR